MNTVHKSIRTEMVNLFLSITVTGSRSDGIRNVVGIETIKFISDIKLGPMLVTYIKIENIGQNKKKTIYIIL